MVQCTVVAWNDKRVTASAKLSWAESINLVSCYLHSVYDYATINVTSGFGNGLCLNYKAYTNRYGRQFTYCDDFEQEIPSNG
jgi:hypothetical protein